MDIWLLIFGQRLISYQVLSLDWLINWKNSEKEDQWEREEDQDLTEVEEVAEEAQEVEEVAQEAEEEEAVPHQVILHLNQLVVTKNEEIFFEGLILKNT